MEKERSNIMVSVLPLLIDSVFQWSETKSRWTYELYTQSYRKLETVRTFESKDPLDNKILLNLSQPQIFRQKISL